jgi:hypothetical protein
MDKQLLNVSLGAGASIAGAADLSALVALRRPAVHKAAAAGTDALRADAAGSALRFESLPAAMALQEFAPAAAPNPLANLADSLLASLSRAQSSGSAASVELGELVSLAESSVKALDGAYRNAAGDWLAPDLWELLASVAGCLAQIAAACASSLKPRLSEYEEQRVRIIAKEERLYKEIDAKTRRANKAAIDLEAYDKRLKALEADLEKADRIYSEACAKLEKLDREKKALRKWCWVPGYNIYLLAEYNEEAGHTERYGRAYVSARNEFMKMRGERQKLIDSIAASGRLSRRLAARAAALDLQKQRCFDAFDLVSARVAQYSELATYFGVEARRLERGETDPETVLGGMAGMRDNIGRIFEKGGIAGAGEDELLEMEDDPFPRYSAHVEGIGWQPFVEDGEAAGTTGQFLRLEALRIALEGAPPGASIIYRLHVQDEGWQDFVANGAIAGTVGRSLRAEAIEIFLDNLPGWSVEYRVHVEREGWQDWAHDGQATGTTGRALRMEAVEIELARTIEGKSAATVTEDLTGIPVTSDVCADRAKRKDG